MNPRRIAGASYIEVLVAMAILAATLLPAVEALQAGMMGSEIHTSQTALHFRISGRLEELLVEPFQSLDDEAQAIGDRNVASTVYSDPTATLNRRLVYLSRYDGDDINPSDGDPFTDTDAGLLWIRVAIEGTPLSLERIVNDDG